MLFLSLFRHYDIDADAADDAAASLMILLRRHG